METNSFLIRPMALYDGDYKIVAERLYGVFKNAPRGPRPQPRHAPAVGNLDGHWDVDIEFVAGRARHTMYLQIEENEIRGLHRGRITQGTVRGYVDGEKVKFESRGKYEAADMRYFFEGSLRGDEMGGELGLGEYGKARWTARRGKEAVDLNASRAVRR